MVTLEMLERCTNDINEIKRKCLEILKFKKEHDKYNLIVSDRLKNVDFSNLDNIQDINFTNTSIKFFIDCSTSDEYIGDNYIISFEEITNENWQKDFLKELNKLEIKYLAKKGLEEQEKLEKLLLREKEEYKRLRKKFEDFYEKNNSDKI